jgi:hypothetical protein
LPRCAKDIRFEGVIDTVYSGCGGRGRTRDVSVVLERQRSYVEAGLSCPP